MDLSHLRTSISPGHGNQLSDLYISGISFRLWENGSSIIQMIQTVFMARVRNGRTFCASGFQEALKSYRRIRFEEETSSLSLTRFGVSIRLETFSEAITTSCLCNLGIWFVFPEDKKVCTCVWFKLFHFSQTLEIFKAIQTSSWLLFAFNLNDHWKISEPLFLHWKQELPRTITTFGQLRLSRVLGKDVMLWAIAKINWYTESDAIITSLADSESGSEYLALVLFVD
jgi:hypothetical protein